MSQVRRNQSQAELEFLANIRQRLGRLEHPERIAPYRRGVPEFYRDIRMSKEEKIQTFIENLEKVNGYGFHVRGREKFLDVLEQIIGRHEFKKAIGWKHPFLEGLNIYSLLGKKDIDVHLWDPEKSPEDNVNAAKEADLGITFADWAIANTGTVALFASGIQGRSVSLLPPAYLVIFTPEQLVTRMGEMLEKCKTALPSSVNFITGPSRSADIEMNLTLGVHGPKYVYAVIYEE